MHSTAIVGRGRMGHALSAALSAARVPVIGPLSRRDLAAADPSAWDAVLLCVPDAAIADAARCLAPRAGLLVGHCSGATGLDVLAPHEAFSLHPLMTVTADEPEDVFAGAGAAVAGSTARAAAIAEDLAARLGMRAIEVPDGDRAAYHAAASIASNFLVTLEAAAERLLPGHDRSVLAPLVRRTVENWAQQGPERALTGPIARGDEATVERQRAAVAERAPELLPLFDALAGATRELAGTPAEVAA